MRRRLISVAAALLVAAGLATVAHATPVTPTGGAAGAVRGAHPDNAPLTANNPGNQTGTVGTRISPLQLSCGGGFPPCFWSVTGLPAGLTWNIAGQITGTPTAAGIFTVTATARDTHNTIASTSFLWTINGAR